MFLVKYLGLEDHTMITTSTVKLTKSVASSKDIINHHQSIQILMTELFNITKNLLPTSLDDF